MKPRVQLNSVLRPGLDGLLMLDMIPDRGSSWLVMMACEFTEVPGIFLQSRKRRDANINMRLKKYLCYTDISKRGLIVHN